MFPFDDPYSEPNKRRGGLVILPPKHQAEEPIDTDQLRTKEKTGDVGICASILDLPTSNYKINEEILAKAQNDDHTTVTKAEVEPFIINQRLVTFDITK